MSKAGRPKLTAVGRAWNDIRNTLTSSAMGYMDIPHAKEFQVRASIVLGPPIRKLVDTEIIAELKTFTGHANEIPESVILARIKELEATL